MLFFFSFFGFRECYSRAKCVVFRTGVGSKMCFTWTVMGVEDQLRGQLIGLNV